MDEADRILNMDFEKEVRVSDKCSWWNKNFLIYMYLLKQYYIHYN